MENQNDEMKNENVELGNEEADELSCEEFEEEDNLYEDENLVSNEDIELFNKHFEVQIVKDIKPEDMMDLEVDPNQEELNFKREYDEFQTDGEIYSIAMNEKGVLVIGDGEDTTYFYDLNKKGLIRKEKMNKDSLVTVAFSFDNKLLATACLDGTVNIFDGEEFKLLNTVNGSFSDINVLNYLKDLVVAMAS
jgi:WD40 repeat protein